MTKTKLYVGNLPYSITNDSLKQLFEPFGEVASANVVTDAASGRSRGFGFVEMDGEDAAKQASEAMNGKDVSGRNIVVNFAKSKTDRPDRGGDRYSSRSGGGGGGRRSHQ